MKIWITTIKNEKIIKSHVYTPEYFNERDIAAYTQIVCNEIDEPTPLFLKKHYMHLKEFSNTDFSANDFVECINFDSMHLQIFDEKDTKKKYPNEWSY